MSPCTILPCDPSDRILGVGWLSANAPFATGTTDHRVYERLVEFSKDPWQPFVACGFHECELCQFGGESCGVANIFIPDGDRLLVCPELILHYMNAHHYQPPEAFCNAVLDCPPMRSQEYRSALVRCKAPTLLKVGT